MAVGLEIYKRFRVLLLQREQTITNWASTYKSSPQAVRGIVVKYAGGEKLPRSPISQVILAAVEAELRGEEITDDRL